MVTALHNISMIKYKMIMQMDHTRTEIQDTAMMGKGLSLSVGNMQKKPLWVGLVHN